MTAQRDSFASGGLRDVTDTMGRYADWEAVYADNAAWVYRMLSARVGNRPDAEDLTAEVFSTALKSLRMTATIAEIRGYLRHHANGSGCALAPEHQL